MSYFRNEEGTPPVNRLYALIGMTVCIIALVIIILALVTL